MSQLFHTGMVTGTVLITMIVVYYTITEHWARIDKNQDNGTGRESSSFVVHRDRNTIGCYLGHAK